MAYTLDEIERMLKKKLKMEIDKKRDDHIWLILEPDGLPVIKTKVSRHKETAGEGLESKICKQLRVRKPFFHELMDCTKSRNDYIVQISTDPNPPFDQIIT